MDEKILEIKDLTVSFGENRVIEDVSFSIKRGEVTALVGESGSGKTMTALSILDLLPDTACRRKGEILFDGKNIFDLGPEELRDMRGNAIAMVFQEPFTALNPVIRIGRQIAEAVSAHGICPRSEVRERIKESLSTVRLPEETVYQYPHELSGGMRQRVMLSMALSCDPAILILDEPTTALDVSIQKHILDLIRHIQKDRQLTVLFITHDFSVVRTIADKVCVMRRGRVVEQGAKEDVLGEPACEYTRQLIACIPVLGDKRERLPVVDG
ncbi:MAG: ABC transporter ATP-binding protein [Candidatus Omnitrophica bacterium]|nr:ABC transporter ATP-binding protein [Candidatus Omnitrophota bacterium]